MKLAMVLSTALLVSVAAWTSQASASAARDATMERCIAKVGKLYPRNDGSQRQQRTALYKSCMTNAGYAP